MHQIRPVTLSLSKRHRYRGIKVAPLDVIQDRLARFARPFDASTLRHAQCRLPLSTGVLRVTHR